MKRFGTWCAVHTLIVATLLSSQLLAQSKEKKPPRNRPDTPIGNLLDDLEQQNKGKARFTDEWLQKLKDVVDLGEAAVPELIAELDYTDNDMMMRCAGFTLRSIGDKRAIPALIRAIPKTLIKPGSDMGLRAKDKDLAKFAAEAQIQHPGHRSPLGQYGFGRPVREIFAALQKISGEDLDDEQLYSMFLSKNEHQNKIARQLFHKQASGWAKWWESHVEDFDLPEEFHKVGLRALAKNEIAELLFDVPYKTSDGGGGSNWMLQAAQSEKGERVFFDFDTARTSKLPKRWRDQREDLPLDEIDKWAASEGFDMMCIEIKTEPDDEPCFVIRTIGMQAVELPMNHWKKQYKNTSLEDLIKQGEPVEGPILVRHRGEQEEHFEHGPFLVVTREGTPGALDLGIEVRDDSLKPGGVSNGDDELNKVAFRKGRRFAYRYLVPVEEK